MASAFPTRAGGCLCGAVRFRATLSALHADACHCGMCRRWAGGSFMTAHCETLEIEDKSALGVYESSEWGQREFCKTCGSSLFWRMRGERGFAAVAVQTLDDLSGFEFTEEIFIDNKPALYAFAGDRPRLTGAEVIARAAAKRKEGA